MPKIHVDFDNMLIARKAVDKMKEMGYKNAHLDIADNFNNEIAEELSFTNPRHGPDLLALASKSGRYKPNSSKALLEAANPLSEGHGSFYRTFQTSNTRLIVSVEDEKVDEIRSILAQIGGHFESL